MGQSTGFLTVQTEENVEKKRKRAKSYGHLTVLGKVIYKRRKHSFSGADGVRIVRHITSDRNTLDPISFREIISLIAGSVRIFGWTSPVDFNNFLETQKLDIKAKQTATASYIKAQWKKETLGAVEKFVDFWISFFPMPTFDISKILKAKKLQWYTFQFAQNIKEMNSFVNDWAKENLFSNDNLKKPLMAFAEFFYDFLFGKS